MASAAAGSSAPATMVFLRAESTALIEELSRRLREDFKPTVADTDTDARISEYDGVQFRLQVAAASPRVATVSMSLPAYKQLLPCGVEEYLKGVYGDLLVAPEAGSDVTVRLDASKLSEEKLAEAIKAVAGLRRNAMAAAFDRAIKAVATKAPLPPEVTIRFRPSEPVFILPRADRVSVVFALEFADPTDWAVARIIAQEFAEAQRAISTAPTVNFSDKEPPLEIRGLKDLGRQSSALVGYLTFALHPRHIDTEAKRRNVINLLTQFRPYLDYHIKAAKSYLHTRMRTRVDGWMQVLNRAQPEDPFVAREKKLASGKTFIKK